MAVRVGIPRALLYYAYYPLWKSFLEGLGAEIVTSGETTKGIVDAGVKVTVDEACFPVKVFHGHVVELKDRVDFLFLPRLVSVEPRAYICPKFMGLPDMIRNNIPGLPPTIDASIDLSKGLRYYSRWVMETGRAFTRDPLRILKADLTSRRVQRRFLRLQERGHTPGEAISMIYEGEPCAKPGKRQSAAGLAGGGHEGLRILLVGHPYTLYDDYVSMGVMEKLRSFGIRVITPEMIPANIIERAAGRLSKRLFWTFGRRMLGTAFYFLESGGVDGCLHLTSFGCGPDSIVGELMEREAKRSGKVPFTTITVDEHTGEAGVVTRLEAFVDMLIRRRSQVR